MKSIRSNLVVWMAISLALSSIAVLAGTYILTRSQVGRVFDDELKQVAQAVHLRGDWTAPPRVLIARPGFFFSVRAYDDTGRAFFETAFPALPRELPPTFKEGFTRFGTDAGEWRIYTHVTPEGIVQVGQPVTTRDELARDLSLPVLTPMLILIPVLVLIIGWVLKRALAPLNETSRRVSDRDASRLDPLPTDKVPSELVPLVSQINALMARLAGSLERRRRFLADVAHELRSPVGALALQVQLATQAHSPSARATAMNELTHGIERARRLVQQLLDYARLEPGVPSDPFVPLNLAKIARDVVGSFVPAADESGVDLGADAPEIADIRGSESELRALIENLLDNALRYAPRGSAVTVTVRQIDSFIEMSVVDSGPGIPEHERQRVFERFKRIPGDTTPGTGLGLAISKAIVERHHGSITLGDADPGARPPGVLVKVRLPVHCPAPVVPQVHQAES